MKKLQKQLFAGLSIFLIVLIPGANAQESLSDYHLIEPIADEYLNIVDAVIERAETNYSFDSFTGGGGRAEWDVMTDEITWRLINREAITYRQLIALYRAYAAAPLASETDTDDRLIPFLIERWLAENPTNLYEIPLLVFDDFVFEVRPLRHANTTAAGLSVAVQDAPFDGAALFHQGFSSRVADFIVISEESSYRVPPLPAPMFDHVVEHGDFNVDGQIDFAYITYTHVGNSFVSGALVVVTWDGTQFEALGNLDFSHGPGIDPELDWGFGNFDADAQREAFGTQRFFDNWGCRFIRLRFFDWQDGGMLAQQSIQDALPGSFPCLVRQAEQHMWQGDYEEAIPLYEQALAQTDEATRFHTYARLKLALAYLLNDQAEAADAAFSLLSAPNDDPDSALWVNVIQEAHARDPRVLPMCQVIYELALDVADPWGISGSVEVYDGGFDRMSAGMAPPVNLENISCNLGNVLASQLAATEFSLNQTPVEQLQALGLIIADSYSADFDGDDDMDWIVWADSPGLDPTLFVAGDQTFSVRVLEGTGSQDPAFRAPDLRTPDEFMQYRVITLPDGTSALAILDVGTDQLTALECGSCGGGPELICVDADPANFPDTMLGDLTIWGLDEEQFTPLLFTEMCAWGTPAELLPGGDGAVVEQFLAGDEFGGTDDWIIELRSVTFTWDAQMRTFLPPPQPTPTQVTSMPTPTALPSTQVQYPLNLYTYLRVREAFALGEFASALELLDTALAEPEQRDETFETTFHYYRALMLEALDRPDEALTEYVALYETAPESAWGLLAALHFDPIQ